MNYMKLIIKDRLFSFQKFIVNEVDIVSESVIMFYIKREEEDYGAPVRCS